MALTKISSNEIQPAAITSDLISADVSLGVKISNVSIVNSSYTILDDTAVDTAGGYIVITGAGFNSGAQVIIGGTNATSVTRVSSTELRAQVPAKSAATYNVYVVNTDGSTGIRVNGLTYSGLPTWVTGSTLDPQSVDVAFNLNFDATSAVSYANTSAIPAGTTLLANGYFYGTITGITEETTYSFTVQATDAENQDASRTFSVTVTTVSEIIADILIVAGGGSGGGSNDSNDGGGGAGGYLSSTGYSLFSGTTYNITVGAGGASAIAAKGFNGSNSEAFGVTAIGGGAGAGATSATGNPGGSGGGGQGFRANAPGGSSIQTSSGSFTAYGFAGGNGVSSASGGGGGAGEAGNTDALSSLYGGAGGDGRTWVDGITYAGGGGGGYGGSAGAGGGGAGGGGGPSSTPGSGSPGSPNTGGGGGGSYKNGVGDLNGSNGGSGVVIIRYADTYADAASTTGSPTYTNTGGYKTYKFTGSGSIRW